MSVLLICTDLSAQDSRVAQLDEVMSHARSACRLLASTWAVFSEESPSKWHDRLSAVLGTDARVLVAEVASNYAVALGPDAKEWLRAHLGTGTR